MVVLIGNLPKQAAEKDICQLLGLAMETRLRIVKKPGHNGVVQRFALVPVDNEKRFRKLIAHVHGMEWHGCTLVAHEYRQRTAANERRSVNWRNRTWTGVERRLDERRSFALNQRSRVA